MRLSFAVWLIALSRGVFAVAGEAATTTSTCRNLESLQVSPPFVAPRILKDGSVLMIDEDDKSVATLAVTACCTASVAPSDSSSSSCKADLSDATLQRQVIGKMPQFTTDQASQALKDAQEAWKGGSGAWPQMSWRERVTAIQNLVKELKLVREEIIVTLMWEIGKNYPDAASEFDRTMSFIQQVIQVIQTELDFGGASWQAQGSSAASSLFTFVRRAALGIVLVLGPYNYPLNETYATLIPALLMGNVCILKIPTVGGLVHLLTLQAFAKALPPGTINFVSGSGRATLPPILKSGAIDALAFVGGSHAADQLIQQHPHPHRLKVFLQLEAKNMGIFLPDLFEAADTGSGSDIPKNSYLDVAVDEALLGALSFNGQRCTALKLLLVPRQHAERFGRALAQRLEQQWSVGLPWQVLDDASSSYPKITPLPNHDRVKYVQQLIQDAVQKGATILNPQGGTIVGRPSDDSDDAASSSSTLMVPAILYPVTPDMDVYHQEQFGPIVPIVPYDELESVLEMAQNGPYGQQVSVFTSSLAADAAPSRAAEVTNMLDRFATIFGKINLNQQCGRSPDTLPFSGRRSSALGVMSVQHVLEEFSVPVVVAYKDHHSLNRYDSGSPTSFSDKLKVSSKFLE